MRRAARTDANQSEIVATLRKCGCSVFSLAAVGKGCPDLLIARAGRTYLAEVKNGVLGYKLTPAQKEFWATWNDDVLIFDSVDSVLAWASVPRVSVKQEAA